MYTVRKSTSYGLLGHVKLCCVFHAVVATSPTYSLGIPTSCLRICNHSIGIDRKRFLYILKLDQYQDVKLDKFFVFLMKLKFPELVGFPDLG